MSDAVPGSFSVKWAGYTVLRLPYKRGHHFDLRVRPSVEECVVCRRPRYQSTASDAFMKTHVFGHATKW